MHFLHLLHLDEVQEVREVQGVSVFTYYIGLLRLSRRAAEFTESGLWLYSAELCDSAREASNRKLR